MKAQVVFLLFALVFVADAVKLNKGKKGVCPRRNWGVGHCAEYCFDDSNCPGNKKCCSTGCGSSCMTPEPAKKGTCPVVIMKTKNRRRCAKFCSDDNDCPGKKKCCSNGCGYRCMAPTPKPAKKGTCPVVIMKTKNRRRCAKFCSDDNDCPGKKKCCSNGCGYRCMAPTPKPGKKGVCPRRNWGVSHCAEYCFDDSHCPGNKKCCSTGCGSSCMTPEPAKKGTCPVVIMKTKNRRRCAKFCSDDNDCPGKKKCCSNGCGYRCMAPTPKPAKKGTCPVVIMKTKNRRRCAKFCSDDNDCPGKKKCCSNGCGYRCMAPTPKPAKKGVCPRRTWGIGHCGEHCFDDSDCPGKKKCCSTGCGHSCMAPEPRKKGVCPRRNWGVSHCAEFCSDDSHCPGNKKCCSTGCGHSCMTPEPAKKGTCPVVIMKTKNRRRCAKFCSDDNDCPGKKKCCSNGCGYRCMAPTLKPARRGR